VSTSNTTVAYIGWLRTGRGPWRRICTATTEAEASRQLFAAAAAHMHVDLCVLPAGTDPNRRQHRARRIGR
jgi:hypothetical protein